MRREDRVLQTLRFQYNLLENKWKERMGLGQILMQGYTGDWSDYLVTGTGKISEVAGLQDVIN